MENVRRRAKIDIDNSTKFGIQGFSKDIIEVADTLDMALENSKASFEKKNNPEFEALYDGLVMINNILHKTFNKHHVKKYKSLGEVFDPNVHDGLFQFPDPTKTPGTVGQVMKEGYVLHERVIRVANVGTVQEPVKE